MEAKKASEILLSIVNQALARGLFNNIEEMPVVLEAVKSPLKFFEDYQYLLIKVDELEGEKTQLLIDWEEQAQQDHDTISKLKAQIDVERLQGTDGSAPGHPQQ